MGGTGAVGSADAAAFAELAALGSATVHEAGGRLPALDHALRPLDRDLPVAGPAFTVRCGVRDNLALHRAVAAAPERSVLIVDAGGDDSAYWGEILTRAALARGVAGVVLDGGIRDTTRIRALGFPAWARHIAIRGVDKAVPGDLDVPIVLAGERVDPGAIVVADADGIVLVPAERLDEVLVAARARAAREAELIDRLRAGELTLDLLGLRDRLPPGEPS
jgi:4-hydroxy-4-methyl-2-oxoglutarate aldolase